MLVLKADRMEEFFRRLRALPPVADLGSARAAVERTLNAVEDEFSGVPFNPENWRTDGRMYPVQDDHIAEVPGSPGVLALRSRGHETLVAPNGAIEIQDARTGQVVFAKNGSNGKGVGHERT